MPPPLASQWKLPPLVKVYEALGAIADDRVRPVQYNTTGGAPSQQSSTEHDNAQVFTVTSSNLDKSYRVVYDPDATRNRILMACNDNGSVFQGYLGYPGVAVLLLLRPLPFGLIVAPGTEDGTRASGVESSSGTRATTLPLGNARWWLSTNAHLKDVVIPLLSGIPWKTLATKHKNDWDRVVHEALSTHVREAEKIAVVQQAGREIHGALKSLVDGGVLWKRTERKRVRES